MATALKTKRFEKSIQNQFSKLSNSELRETLAFFEAREEKHPTKYTSQLKALIKEINERLATYKQAA